MTAPARRGVASALPGRIRLRDPTLRQRAASERLAVALRALRGVRQVDANLAAGSLLVQYDAAACDRAELEAQVAQLVAATLPAAAAAPTPAPMPATASSSPSRRSRRNVSRAANRVAKIGMLTSFPLALALAATGNKRLHAAAGGVFTAFLAVHWVVHRRHLFK